MKESYTALLGKDHMKMLDDLTSLTSLNISEILKKLIEESYFSMNSKNGIEARIVVSDNKSVIIDGFNLGDELSDGICVTDQAGVVLRVNNAYTRITGINEAEIVGQPIQYYIDKKYFNNPVSLRVLKEKKKISAMSTVASNNKKVLLTGTPIFNKQGELIQVYTIMRDLTELIQLKEQLEQKERENESYYKALAFFNENKAGSSFIGQSASIIKIKKLIEQISNTDATVLITGETGVGKEVLANEVYYHSTRDKKPFIKVNCAAIPESLLESELFGYEKGAFTGAQQKTKLGLLELADKGTILLDEIGEMPIKLQSKLLRCLQEKEITRLGGTKPIKIDVRIIAATNQDILKQIKDGTFREDLYYRLNVIQIKIPPLRDRIEDIFLLSNNFLEKFNRKYKKKKKLESEEANVLANYHWPGNIRELENTIERLVIIGENEFITRLNIYHALGEDNFSSQLENRTLMSLKEAVDDLERDIISKALKKYGSTHKAAKVLGVTQPTVVRKAKSLGIKQW